MQTKPITYTEEFVLSEVTNLLKYLKENKNIVYLWEMFEEKEYPRQCFSEWAEKFASNAEISDTIKVIREILETRAIVWAMKEELNPTSTIFHLKNNYKWVDKQEIDQRNLNIDTTPTELANMTDEQLQALLK